MEVTDGLFRQVIVNDNVDFYIKTAVHFDSHRLGIAVGYNYDDLSVEPEHFY